MPDFNPKRGRDLKPEVFAPLKRDLELLDNAFDRVLLAQWLGLNKGNFSKLMLGTLKLTMRFHHLFYEKLGQVVKRKKEGISSEVIKAEMEVNESPQAYPTLKDRMKALEGRIAHLEEKVNHQEAEIQALKGQKGPEGLLAEE